MLVKLTQLNPNNLTQKKMILINPAHIFAVESIMALVEEDKPLEGKTAFHTPIGRVIVEESFEYIENAVKE